MISTQCLFENPLMALSAVARGVGSAGRGTGTMSQLFGRDRQAQQAMSASQTGSHYEKKPGQGSLDRFANPDRFKASKLVNPTDASKWHSEL